MDRGMIDANSASNHDPTSQRTGPASLASRVLRHAILALGLALGVGAMLYWRIESQHPHGTTTADGAFLSCREAIQAGAAPLYRGEPGYAPELDPDHDGIACKPYHGA